MALTSPNIISTYRSPKGNGKVADKSAPTNRIAATPVGHLNWWDVVDKGTLEVIDKIMYGIGMPAWRSFGAYSRSMMGCEHLLVTQRCNSVV
ncbi:hypothetical protein OEA23_18245 [Paenibacillus polysaccharolyticus]|uniref:hypothetical protein n=1 Tax=Paenibacillus polysaccharolyticus TaxID=582692 RepID=UPI003DA2C14B